MLSKTDADLVTYLGALGLADRTYKVTTEDDLICITFFRTGPQRSYPVAELQCTRTRMGHPLGQQLISATWAPKTRKNFTQMLTLTGLLHVPRLQGEATMDNLVASGWISKLTELQEHGTLRMTPVYLPGPTLLAERHGQEQMEADAELRQRQEIEALVCSLENAYGHIGFEPLREACLATERALEDRHFLAAVLQVASRLDVYDWKEIGAHYLRPGKRHPSKQFDARRDRLISLLSNLLGGDIGQIGLDTLPDMPVVFFAGKLTVRIDGLPDRVFYDTPWPEALVAPAVKAATEITHDGQAVIAVENRAVLRRLVRHYNLPNRDRLLFCAYEGQVRSSHYRFLELLALGGARELIIWSDGDSYSLSMLDKLATLPYPSIQVVAPPGRCLPLAAGRKAIEKLLADGVTLYEQERDIGQPAVWQEMFGGVGR